jgi:transposase-like protein
MVKTEVLITIKCPRCGKKWVRANQKLRNFVCRSCGNSWTDPSLMPEEVIIV